MCAYIYIYIYIHIYIYIYIHSTLTNLSAATFCASTAECGVSTAAFLSQILDISTDLKLVGGP